MKKNLIALLIVALVTVGLFAATNPSNAEFTVKTTIDGINDMRITKTPVALSTFDTANNLFTELSIGGATGAAVDTTTGVVTFNAYISTRSNNRKGYTVKLSATPMTSAPSGQTSAEINYTVAVAGDEAGSFDTAEDTTAVEVIVVESLSAVGVESRKISLTVDADEYTTAVEGTYTGIVTFNYIAN
jgi:hypothetical protein